MYVQLPAMVPDPNGRALPVMDDTFVETATHATEAVASKTAAAGKRHIITGFCASSDKAGSIVLVKDGATTIYQAQVDAGHIEKTFLHGIPCSTNSAASVTIDGTAACKANIEGFTVTLKT